MNIAKLILNDESTNDQLIFSIGDEDELVVYYSHTFRKCYVLNKFTQPIVFSIRRLTQYSVLTKLMRWFFKGKKSATQTVVLSPANTYYIDNYAVDTFGKSSIVEDVTFTSTKNVWGFDYNNQCVSKATYGEDTQYNRILASIVSIAKLN